MNVKFLDIAQSELDETIEYYNRDTPGMGDVFSKK